MSAENTLKRSIVDLAQGAIKERIDVEMGKIIANIMNENTKPDAKRKLTLTLEFLPDEDRYSVGVKVFVKSQMAPLKSVATSLRLGGTSEHPMAVEAKADLPGQGSLFDENRLVELNVVNS